jgi:hypothetical protein
MHTQILDFFMILQTCNRIGAECITTAASRAAFPHVVFRQWVFIFVETPSFLI